MQTGTTYRAALRWRREPSRSPRLNGVRQPGTQPEGMSSGAVVPAPGAGPAITVRLFGPLSVAIDGVLVENWTSIRQRSLFSYLLTHRQPWPPRDVLMDVFWPNSPPVAARNSLNVAMHGLRRTLKAVTDAPVVIYADGGYRLHPDIRLWLDIEEFDRYASAGRRHERNNQSEPAAEAYEFAVTLYRGDFLVGSLYEDWPSAIRDRLRLAYLDVLGHLSGLHFADGRYAACADVCGRIIECDSCREDAHRRLMLCYSRQGQSHLALIQYRACVQALARELGVGPDPATVALYERIRRHERV